MRHFEQALKPDDLQVKTLKLFLNKTLRNFMLELLICRSMIDTQNSKSITHILSDDPFHATCYITQYTNFDK